MSRTARRVWLSVVAALCAVTLFAALRERGARVPALSDTPANWLLASEIADGALDRDSPRRFALWRAAYAHAKLLAPRRVNADAAFVRAGLFHWYELQSEDRARVMQAAGPLMRDPLFFARMHVPLLQLTRDFAWIRTHAPQTLDTRAALRNLAISQGLFSEYRALRDEVRATRLQTFAARRRGDDPSALAALLPEHLDLEDQPLVQGILEELDRQAFDPTQVSPRADEVVTFALDHHVGPLTGVQPLLEPPSRLRDVTRARVALALDRATDASRIEMTSTTTINADEWRPYYLDRARFEARRGDASAANAYLFRASSKGMTIPVLDAAAEVARILRRTSDEQRYLGDLARAPRAWQGLCGTDEICGSAHTDAWSRAPRTEKITLANTQSDETPPYVEIYAGGLRVAEGEVRDTRTFEVPLPAGAHEIEVRLMNQRTRNGVQRRVRLWSAAASAAAFPARGTASRHGGPAAV